MSQQAMFTKAKSQSEAAVKASFIVAAEIAKSSRPFTEGEFVKNCMIKVCDTVCPEKRQAFLNVSLSRNTVADHVRHLAANLQQQLQGRGRIITDMDATVRACKTKLRLLETQILQENLSHFPHCQTMKEKVAAAVFPTRQFTEKLGILGADFIRRFADFEAPKSRFELLSNPFAADVESAPSNLQMELIELQCSDTLKAKYESVGAAEFPRFIPDTMPHLRSQAAQTLSMFGSTYLCEQLFSLMKINKTSHRTRLTDEHLHSILRISSAQSLTPDIDDLVTKIRHQASGSDK